MNSRRNCLRLSPFGDFLVVLFSPESQSACATGTIGKSKNRCGVEQHTKSVLLLAVPYISGVTLEKVILFGLSRNKASNVKTTMRIQYSSTNPFFHYSTCSGCILKPNNFDLSLHRVMPTLLTHPKSWVFIPDLWAFQTKLKRELLLQKMHWIFQTTAAYSGGKFEDIIANYFTWNLLFSREMINHNLQFVKGCLVNMVAIKLPTRSN